MVTITFYSMKSEIHDIEVENDLIVWESNGGGILLNSQWFKLQYLKYGEIPSLPKVEIRAELKSFAVFNKKSGGS